MEREMPICIYKQSGETPLEAIERYRIKHSDLHDVSLTYAGRLDPLAEGLLLVLAGERVHQKEQYLALPKRYELTILFGVSTDTYDVLGKVQESTMVGEGVAVDRLRNILDSLTGVYEQAYPPYSSQTVAGKPLWMWAREGKLSEIEIPRRRVEIYDIHIRDMQNITPDVLRESIQESISGVHGDFRQEEILDTWQHFFEDTLFELFPTVSLQVQCSSGTYMRSLAVRMGQMLGVPALALHIKRTAIGDYTLGDISF